MQMNIEEYLQLEQHRSKNEAELLGKFTAFMGQCRDPFNVFRFMEERAICTFLPRYWLFKAEYMAQLGDYTRCFKCIEEAESRNGTCDDESDHVMGIDKKHEEYQERLKEEMGQWFEKDKRSYEEFNLMIQENQQKDEKYRQKLLKLYQEEYAGLKERKKARFELQRKKMPKSWLTEFYEKEDQEEEKMEKIVHENSVKLSREVKHHSMHTPFKMRNPSEISEACDSVERLRRQRSSHTRMTTGNPEDEEELLEEDMFNSLPVGRKLAEVGRRVTFKEIPRGPQSDVKKLQNRAGSSILKRTSRSRSFHKRDQNSLEK